MQIHKIRRRWLEGRRKDIACDIWEQSDLIQSPVLLSGLSHAGVRRERWVSSLSPSWPGQTEQGLSQSDSTLLVPGFGTIGFEHASVVPQNRTKVLSGMHHLLC
jgi:hypothetical protein